MMTTIPETLTKIAPILQLYWLPLLSWLSQAFIDKLLSRYHQHPLVQLAELIDFEPLEKACQPYHQENGLGCPVVHSVPRLIRVIFLKYFGNHSYRETEMTLAGNLFYRWFTGYGLFDKPADRTTINSFEQYLRQHHPRLYFDEFLRQVDEAHSDQRDAVQIADTFAVEMNAAYEPLIPRLRHLAERLRWAYLEADSHGYHQMMPHLMWAGLVAEETERPYSRLTKPEQEARLTKVVIAITHMVGLLPEDPPPSVSRWTYYIEKVIFEEVEEVVSQESGEVSYRQRKGQERRGGYYLLSATDPEATCRNHGDDLCNGYNVSVATTTDFIREISAATGSEPDAEGLSRLLEKQIEHHQVYPPKIIYDQAAGRGIYCHQVTQLSGGRTQLVAKMITSGKRADTFRPTDFSLSEDALTLTCPNGRQTVQRYWRNDGAGHNFNFSAGQCRGCPLLTACRGSEEYPIKRRTVFISHHHQALLLARAYMQTADFRADLKLRPQVERVIAGLVRFNGARRARVRGLKNVDFQMKMCAMAYNVKRWLQKRKRKKPPSPPREMCV